MKSKMRPKKMASFKLCDKAMVFLKAIADSEDMTMTTTLEILLKEEGKRRGMDLEYDKLKEKYGEEEVKGDG